jgi:hypothetical protein
MRIDQLFHEKNFKNVKIDCDLLFAKFEKKHLLIDFIKCYELISSNWRIVSIWDDFDERIECFECVEWEIVLLKKKNNVDFFES